MNIRSVGGLLLMVVAGISLVLMHALFSPSPFVIAAQVAGVGLMLWARFTFGRRSFHASAEPTAGGLVTTGPYRFIRHPIYAAACLICLAGVLGNLSILSVLAGALLVVGAVVRMLADEKLVTARYPEYRDYAKVTKRMVPYVF
jgi:protein-S-isoprenylcysteine O-methyltransferase Ste14